MSRSRETRARWDARRRLLLLPLPEHLVIRAAAQLGRQGISGIESLGSWLRRFVRIAAAKPRGRPSSGLRTASGRLKTLAETELAAQLKTQLSFKGFKIK